MSGLLRDDVYSRHGVDAHAQRWRWGMKLRYKGIPLSAPSIYLDGRVAVHAGDCLATIKSLADNSIDACVSDPPYALVSIIKRFGADRAAK